MGPRAVPGCPRPGGLTGLLLGAGQPEDDLPPCSGASCEEGSFPWEGVQPPGVCPEDSLGVGGPRGEQGGRVVGGAWPRVAGEGWYPRALVLRTGL